MNTHEPAPPWTLAASNVGTLINTAGKLFHVQIAEGKYEFWWHSILENGIWNFWPWPLVVLVVAGVRYICDGMAIRWWTILYIITTFVLVLLCCKVGHFSSFSIDVTLLSLEKLMKCNLSETEICSFCFETRESLVHLFFHCPHVLLIWFQVAHCLQTKCNIDFVISPEICILGVLTGQYFNILNTLIVIVKYFIYVCKLKNQIPVWKDCVEYIKYCKKIDFDSLYLCTPKKSNSLKCKWNSISSMLQWVWCFQCLILGHKYKAELFGLVFNKI